MKLTPLDIRKQEFSRRVRGVDDEEVKAFLQMVASQWEEIQDDQRRLEDKVRELDGKLEHYKRVEEALQEAVRTARENARDALDTARQKAQVIVQEAEASATHIKRDADDERRKMKRQIARLSHRRDEIVSRLRAFLMSEMEMLARFDGDDAVGFIKLMPAQEKPVREAHDAPDALDAPDSYVEPAIEDETPQTRETPAVEAPLPPWAQFADPDEASSASEEPEIPEIPVIEEATAASALAPEELFAPAPDAPEQVEEARDEPVPAPVSEMDWTAEPAFQAEEPNASGFEDASDEPEVEPVAATQDDAQGRSRWLSDHLFSAFKARGQSGDGTESVSTPAPSRYDAPAPPVEEEEESFTVSSEEVERIRRILKGLD